MNDARWLRNVALAALVLMPPWAQVAGGAAARVARPVVPPRDIVELKPFVVIALGKTADWVAIGSDAVWVGSTGPNAVSRIDPVSNRLIATVPLGGAPCAGLAIGFGSVWVPLCGKKARLARVDLNTNTVAAVLDVGPPVGEGGIAASPDSIWLVTDQRGSLVRIDPATNQVRQTSKVPAGSFNPLYAEGVVWVTRAAGAELTGVDAATGQIIATLATDPGPRFLTAGPHAVWTLNQGTGSLTQIDALTRQPVRTIALGTPGRGGDIAFDGESIWTTMPKVPLSVIDGASGRVKCQWAGPGGDSLGIGFGAIWLTDYTGGTVSRLDRADALRKCGR